MPTTDQLSARSRSVTCAPKLPVAPTTIARFPTRGAACSIERITVQLLGSGGKRESQQAGCPVGEDARRSRIGQATLALRRSSKHDEVGIWAERVDAYANYMKQLVPRWLSTDGAVIAGYIALVDKVCPCVLLTHSQGGSFGLK